MIIRTIKFQATTTATISGQDVTHKTNISHGEQIPETQDEMKMLGVKDEDYDGDDVTFEAIKLAYSEFRKAHIDNFEGFPIVQTISIEVANIQVSDEPLDATSLQ